MCDATGIATPRWHSFTHHAFTELGAASTVEPMIAELGLPLVVKPARQGSSMGLHIVESKEAFLTAVVAAFSYDNRIIVERFVDGREFAVTILGPSSCPDPLPVVEIETDEPFYTFHAHYEIGAARLVLADLPPEVLDATKALALRAYSAARCRDFARVDIRLASDAPQVLEINTIPGLTETGPTPVAASMGGLSFRDLIARVCERVMA